MLIHPNTCATFGPAFAQGRSTQASLSMIHAQTTAISFQEADIGVLMLG